MKDRIKAIRKHYDLTQAEFGDRIGVKGNTITNYENNLRNPSDAIIVSICREFNVNEEWLRYGVGDILVIPEDEDAALVSELLENPDNKFYRSVLNLIKTYKEVSPASQKVLDEFAEKYLENEKNQKA